MRWINKQRGALLSVLGVGLGLLVLDMLSSNPEAAEASSETSDTNPSGVATPIGAPATTSKPRSSDVLALGIIATRLQAIDTGEMKHDPDAPHTFSGLRLLEVEPVSITINQPVPVMTAEEFEERHHIVAIMTKGREPGVFIDKRFYRVGDEIDGQTIVGLAERSVVLESESGRIEVRLKDPEVELLDR